MFEIETWGTFDFLQVVFNAIAAIFNSAELTYAAYTVVAISLLYYLVRGSLTSLYSIATSYFIILVIFFSFFHIKTDVLIRDRGTGESGTVSNVPVAVAFWGSMFSKLEIALTRLFDAAYTLPGSLTYSQAGYAYWQNLYASLPRLRQIAESTPFISYTFDNFVRNCVLPSMIQGRITSIDLVTKTLQDATQNVNPALSSYVMDTNGSIYLETCDSVHSLLFTNPNYLPRYSTMSPSDAANYIRSAVFPSYKTSKVQSLITDASNVNSYLIGISADINSIIVNALAADMFASSLLGSAATDPSLASYISTLTIIRQIQERSAIAELGKRWIPVIRQILEVILYGIMPIIAIMLLSPLRSKVLSSIILVGLWLSMWGPVFSILNFVVAVYSKNAYEVYTGSASFVLSAYAVSGLVGASNDIVTLASSLAWLVPILSFAIASGSLYAFVHVSSAVQGLVSGAGTAAAAHVANPQALAGSAAAGSSAYAQAAGRSPFDPGVQRDFFSSFSSGMAVSAMVNRGQYNASAVVGAQRVEAGAQIGQMRSTGDALGFGSASSKFGLTPYQTAQRFAYLSTQTNMGTQEAIQDFANKYFGGNISAAKEFMTYINESGALARWRALANVARQTGIAPRDADGREAGLAMYRYLQSATVKGQYGQSYRLNDLLSELSRATGMSQTEILKGMAGGQGFTFTDKDGSVKTIKFDGNGNAIIARSEKGISGSINLGGAVTMQSGVVKTEGVGDNMVTTYSGIFSYKGRDGKQHTLKGSVTLDNNGNVVSIKGAGGAQVSDAVKEDFMNALSTGNRKTHDDSHVMRTGVDIGDVNNAVQLIERAARGELPPQLVKALMDYFANYRNLREVVISQLADYGSGYGDKQISKAFSVGEKVSGQVEGGAGVNFIVKAGASSGKSWTSGETDGSTFTTSVTRQRVARIFNEAVRKYRSGSLDAKQALSYIYKEVNSMRRTNLNQGLEQSAKVQESEKNPHMYNIIDRAKDDAVEMTELGRRMMGKNWEKGSEQFGGKDEPPAP